MLYRDNIAMEKIKKERIIAAATRLWRQAHKISKVSLEEIAREAGVSPTTIYNNFGTREGLMQEVIRHLSQEIMDQMQAVMESDLPYPLKMQGMVAAKLNKISGLQSELIEKIWTDPASRRYVEEITKNQAEPMIKKIIEQGKTEGYIHADIPTDLVVLYFNILKDGTEANKSEVARLSADKNLMLKFARLMYFGLFCKEFDLTTGEFIEGKEQ
jgi:AcrR family transcriptional regulator